MGPNEVFLGKLLARRCGGCGGSNWLFDALVLGRLPVRDGAPAGEWDFEGADLMTTLYAIRCLGCDRASYRRSDQDGCPKCWRPGAAEHALTSRSRIAVPARCSCGSADLIVHAYAPVSRISESREIGKMFTLSAPGTPGFHVEKIVCPSCGQIVASDPGPCAVCA